VVRRRTGGMNLYSVWWMIMQFEAYGFRIQRLANDSQSRASQSFLQLVAVNGPFSGMNICGFSAARSGALACCWIVKCQMLGCPMNDVICTCQMTERPNDQIVQLGLLGPWVIRSFDKCM